MTNGARVLVYNDTPSEADMLATKLLQRGYESIACKRGEDALDLVVTARPDVIILGEGSQGNSSLNLTRALKNRSETAQVPLILIANENHGSAHSDGLKAGADACLPHGYHDLQLFNRLDSLARINTMQAELRHRAQTCAKYGSHEISALQLPEKIDDAQFLLVGPTADDEAMLEETLAEYGTIARAHTTGNAYAYLEKRRYDAILINVAAGDEENYLQFCRHVRRDSKLFNTPLVCFAEADCFDDPGAPYLAGASDVLYRPTDPNELKGRLGILIKQQYYRVALLTLYGRPHDVATSDALTGLYHRGFLMEHLSQLVADAHTRHKNLTLALFSVENLHEINKLHGYAMGDKVLQQIGILINTLVRGEDLSARLSGSRFALLMPETPPEAGTAVAHRISSVINYTELSSHASGQVTGEPIRPHVATGIASLEYGWDAETLIAEAIANSA